MPRAWSVRFSDGASLQRSRLTRPAKFEVNRVRRALADGPYDIPTAIELQGFPDSWRVKLSVGNRRLIFRMEPETQRIIILEILSREEAYDRYPIPDDE